MVGTLSLEENYSDIGTDVDISNIYEKGMLKNLIDSLVMQKFQSDLGII